MTRFLHILIGILGCAVLAGTSSCSMIEDDVTDCPSGLYVRFVYDYNTIRADLFKDHVGHVRLYVYDESGNKVAERIVSNTDGNAPLLEYAYTVHFNPSELPAGRYRLQAVAMQKDWDEALSTPGAKYRRTEVTHDRSLSITLDHSDTPVEGSDHHEVVHNNAPLDTLWHTLKVMAYEPQDGRSVPALHRTKAPYSVYPMEDQLVTVQNDRATYATVSLIRNTKHLNVTLRQIDLPAHMFDREYELTIVDNNATVAHDNEVSSCHRLRYTPFTSWTTRFDSNGVDVEDYASYQASLASASRAAGESDGEVQRTAHYNLMFNRLMFDNSTDGTSAQLQIRNLQSGKVVALVDLAKILAQGRTAYEYNYSPQEYLDREYDYHLDFLLKGDSWAYCDIVINVLSWAKRVQNEQL